MRTCDRISGPIRISNPQQHTKVSKSVVDLLNLPIGRDPNARKVVRVYLVVYELSQARLMHVNAARLPVVDLTVYYGGVGAGFHFETGDSVVVDVVRFKVAL